MFGLNTEATEATEAAKTAQAPALFCFFLWVYDLCLMTQQINPPAPPRAATASEFYQQMEQFAANGAQGFAMCRATFNRLVRESGVNEWHAVTGLRRVFTLGPKEAPLLSGCWIVLREDIPPGKVARIAERAIAPPDIAADVADVNVTAPPSLNDGPPVVVQTPTQVIMQKIGTLPPRGLAHKAGKGRRKGG